MSRITEVKTQQGYVERHTANVCKHCDWFTSDHVTLDCGWVKEMNLRCQLGGFAVKKMASCSKFVRGER